MNELSFKSKLTNLLTIAIWLWATVTANFQPAQLVFKGKQMVKKEATTKGFKQTINNAFQDETTPLSTPSFEQTTTTTFTETQIDSTITRIKKMETTETVIRTDTRSP